MELDCLLPYAINQTVVTTLFAKGLIYTGCLLEHDQKYVLIAWARSLMRHELLDIIFVFLFLFQTLNKKDEVLCLIMSWQNAFPKSHLS